MLRDAALPLPETNRLVDARYVDCRWPDRGLTIELMGFRYHGSRQAWEADHARRREARARGERFLALTHDDVTRHRDATLAELRELLGGQRRAGGARAREGELRPRRGAGV